MDIYKSSVCKNVWLENILYFGKYKKEKFMRVNSSTIVVKSYIFLSENFDFFLFLKI
jgi:hypothetical protein